MNVETRAQFKAQLIHDLIKLDSDLRDAREAALHFCEWEIHFVPRTLRLSNEFLEATPGDQMPVEYLALWLSKWLDSRDPKLARDVGYLACELSQACPCNSVDFYYGELDFLDEFWSKAKLLNDVDPVDTRVQSTVAAWLATWLVDSHGF
jgi:hypothetical protein